MTTPSGAISLTVPPARTHSRACPTGPTHPYKTARLVVFAASPCPCPRSLFCTGCRSWNATCLTRAYWAGLCTFADEIGAEIIYGLHAGRMADNFELLAAIDANRSACPKLKGFSIGNEGA